MRNPGRPTTALGLVAGVVAPPIGRASGVTVLQEVGDLDELRVEDLGASGKPVALADQLGDCAKELVTRESEPGACRTTIRAFAGRRAPRLPQRSNRREACALARSIDLPRWRTDLSRLDIGKSEMNLAHAEKGRQNRRKVKRLRIIPSQIGSTVAVWSERKSVGV
jgi:hypothetical protein